MTDRPASNGVPTTGVLLSGGLDSAILLCMLLSRAVPVQPFYVRFGLRWEAAELRAVGRFLAAVASPRLAELLVFDQPVADLYGPHWSLTGEGVPDAGTPDDAVHLPGRNLLLILKPALWCQQRGIRQLALAPLAGNPFHDATPAFYLALQEALCRAGGAPFELLVPFRQLTKKQVMDIGRHDPLHLTFSCIDPVGDQHCGRCNKCHERREAFRLAGMVDPTGYARPEIFVR